MALLLSFNCVSLLTLFSYERLEIPLQLYSVATGPPKVPPPLADLPELLLKEEMAVFDGVAAYVSIHGRVPRVQSAGDKASKESIEGKEYRDTTELDIVKRVLRAQRADIIANGVRGYNGYRERVTNTECRETT